MSEACEGGENYPKTYHEGPTRDTLLRNMRAAQVEAVHAKLVARFGEAAP